jgi:agmatinase
MSWAGSEALAPGEAVERLRASTAKVVVVGLPTSRNASHLRASADAPALVADALFRVEGNPYAESGVDLGADCAIQYIGALALETDDEFDRIRCVAAAAFRLGKRPLFIGGDHSVSFPVIAGLHEVLGPVGIVHFDAHPDLYHELQGNPLSHASPFARIMERGYASTLWQYGIRTLTPHQREQMQRFGVHCHEMRHQPHWPPPGLTGPVYVSIDLDALDPAFAPGVAHHEPGGLSVRELLHLVHAIEGPVIGADVVEYLPTRDLQGVTAVVAAKLARELAGVMLTGQEPK